VGVRPAYLESSNERNVPLYERLGFEVRERYVLPSGPPVWLMWRPAAPG
jgi:ribosomal protein S18 acetylase RimI-like enzyme